MGDKQDQGAGSGKKAAKPDREKRLADALRANLKRRKAQIRERRAPAGGNDADDGESGSGDGA